MTGGGGSPTTPRGGGRLPAAAETLGVLAALVVVIGAAVAISRPLLTLTDDPQPMSSAPPDDPEAFTRWFTATRGVEDTGVPADILVEGADVVRDSLRQQRQLAAAGDERARALARVGAVGNDWTWLGPSNHGGRTRAFVDLVDAPDSTQDVMLVAGITGGIWRSVNGGTTWDPLTDSHSNIAVGVLEVSPDDPTVLYAGTGEVYMAVQSENRGAGIMRSGDSGLTWEFLPSTRNNSNFWWVGDVEVSHNDPDTLYAATSTGVWLSTDGGDSWGAAPVVSATAPGCQELAIRSDRAPDVVLASCGNEHGPDGVYYSDDAANRGTRWQRVNFPGLPTHGFAALAIAPGQQDVMYASVSATNRHAAGLFRSDQGGTPDSWSRTTAPDPAAPDANPDWLAYCEREYRGGGQGGYDNTIAVDPTDPNRLWVGGINLYRSEDGGATLQRASDWKTDAGAAYVHADQHLIAFKTDYGSSNRTVYFANDGGLYRTEDDGVDLTSQDTRPEPDLGPYECRAIPDGMRFVEMNDYGVTQFISGSVSDDGQAVLGGTQDNGTYLLSAGGGTDAWVQVRGGDGGYSPIDSASGAIFMSYIYFDFYRGSISNPTGYSYADGRQNANGVEVRGATTLPECSPQNQCSLFYPPLEIDPNNGQVLWTGGSQIWRSTNQGAHWFAASALLPTNAGLISAIAIARGDSEVVWFGTTGGYVWRRAVGGDWEYADPAGSLPTGASVSSITIDPVDPSVVYVGFRTFNSNAHQIWKTTANGGWQTIDISITDDDGDEVAMDYPVNTIAVNPLNTQMVYAGTDMGVFESLDGGDTWRVANGRLATTIVSRLVFRTTADAGTSELYAFTHGRGVYRVNVGDAAELLTLPPG